MNDNLIKKRILIIGASIVLCLIGLYVLISYYQELRGETKEIIKNDDIKKESKNKNDESVNTIKVDIKGEVKRPNIYEASDKDRVIDIINKAGGLTKEADTTIINLSKKLTDEMVIIIYSKKQMKEYEKTKILEEQKLNICKEEITNDACINSKDISNSKENDVSNLININTATKEELQALPRIGENKAKNIISYREKNGSFKTIEEIKNVPGIGDSIFDQIKENITI